VSKNSVLEVAVRDGMLVISIGVDVLAFSFSHHSDSYDDEGEHRADWPKVIDAEQFARDVKMALDDEEEDGTTPVHRLLDAAMLEACEQGSLGVEVEDDDDDDDALPTDRARGGR
jgi:hypothetical protein